jgi:SAM-dependent methyltransferase
MPVFIDVPSFEKYIDGTPWIGYRQFCELFLYPLMLMAYKNISYQPLLRGKIEGITPQDCNNIFSWRDRLRSGVFMHVYLQSKLQSGFADSGRQVKKEIQSSGFSKELILSNLRKLRRIITNLEWKQASSQWSDYAKNTSYTELDTEKKIDFVKSVIGERKRALVWDLGCNTGRYSRIASENSEYVVAMDSDHLAVEYLYRELRGEFNRKILPLVVNLADPSPNLGWRCKERKELADRGKPELILALALVHHMAISANIPIADFIDWLASMGNEVIIEFVSKEDPMAQRLLRNKEDQYDDYDEGEFVECLRNHFKHVRKEPLSSGTRSLYHTREPLRT